MEPVLYSARGLSLLLNLNWDRLFYVGAVAVALCLGTALGSLFG